MNSNRKETPLDSVFFEKQFGNLCGEHCINNALQHKAFDPVSLSMIATGVDTTEENLRYEEKGEAAREKSANFDDTGYFSVNVLAAALGQHSLDLIPLNRTEDPHAAMARSRPAAEQLFVFHEKDHWYCARNFANKQWILLDSTKSGPVEQTEAELTAMVLSKNPNRQTFFIRGSLAKQSADEVYSRVMYDTNGGVRVFRDPGQVIGSTESEAADLEYGIALSLGKTQAEILREQRSKFLQRFEQKKDVNSGNVDEAGGSKN